MKHDDMLMSELVALCGALGVEMKGGHAERNEYEPVTNLGWEACERLVGRRFMTLGQKFHVTRAGFAALNEIITRVTAAPGIFDEADRAERELAESVKRIDALVELRMKEARGGDR